MKIEELIQKIVENPTENNKKEYENVINQLEYDLAMQGNKVEAFSIRGKCAEKMLKEWVSKYKSTEGCPCSYADTLNIPFRQIKKPIAS